MSNVLLGMLSYEMHFLVERLDSCHIRSRVIGKLYLLTSADTFGTPVEVSHVYRTAYLACDSVESCLPTLYRLTGALWCKGEMNCLLCLHLLDYAENDIASLLSVYRNTPEFA